MGLAFGVCPDSRTGWGGVRTFGRRGYIGTGGYGSSGVGEVFGDALYG
jgi:hypothetical protein